LVALEGIFIKFFWGELIPNSVKFVVLNISYGHTFAAYLWGEIIVFWGKVMCLKKVVEGVLVV
jgi:hypothetical protein